MPLQEGGKRRYRRSAKIDEGWVREPGAKGWVEEDAVGSRWSLASADYECIHGRLAGDACPQPAFVPGSGGDLFNPIEVPNPSRLWDKPYPCGCWPGEARVETPDPFAGITRARLSHEESIAGVRGPKSHSFEVENGKKDLAVGDCGLLHD